MTSTSVIVTYLGSDPRKQMWRNGESDRAGGNSVKGDKPLWQTQKVNYPCGKLSLTGYTLPQTCMKYTLKSAARRWGAWLIYLLTATFSWLMVTSGRVLTQTSSCCWASLCDARGSCSGNEERLGAEGEKLIVLETVTVPAGEFRCLKRIWGRAETASATWLKMA